MELQMALSMLVKPSKYATTSVLVVTIKNKYFLEGTMPLGVIANWISFKKTLESDETYYYSYLKYSPPLLDVLRW